MLSFTGRIPRDTVNVFFLAKGLAFTVVVSSLAADSAAVSGTVVNDLTGAPLHMALVTISTTGTKPLDAAVYTDASGSFSFEVPPGRYYLHAGESGYQNAWFGAPTLDLAPAVMTLHAGETRQGLRLRLRPFSSISGTVVDQDNDPVPNVLLRLESPVFRNGRRTFQPANGGNSDDHGQFRLHGIRPGRYYLMASAMNRAASVIHPDVSLGGDPVPERMWSNTFFPGVTDIQQAAAIEVRPGSEIREIVIHMEGRPAAVVSGKVELPEGVSAAGGIGIQFTPLDEPGFQMGGLGNGVMPDGTFPPRTMAAGRYRVTATLNGDDEYGSSEEFDIEPGPQEITAHLTKGARIAGRLLLQGPGGGDLTKEEVTLSSPGAVMMRRNFRAGVKADGTFEFPAVSPGIWDIGVRPIPKGGYIQSMMLGDQDVLTEEMKIGPRTSAPLNIVISTRGAVVRGTVKEPQDDMAELTGRPRSQVLLAPAGKFSQVQSFFRTARTDEAGKYEFRGIRPGSYKIFALDRLPRGSWNDPDFMKRIDALGKPLEIREGDQLKMDLDQTPLPPGGSESAEEQ